MADDAELAASEEKAEPALSVSAAMGLAKGALESIVVRLVGEVSELNDKPGYKAVYFTVKDEKASLPCMMWMSRYQAAGVQLAVGALVEMTGRFSLYAAKGRMNFDVFSVTLAGEGQLRLQVANLARELEAKREDIVFALEAITDPVSLYEPVYSDSGDAVTVMDQVKELVDGEVPVFQLDIDENQEAANSAGVKSIPSFLIYNNGVEAWRHTGEIDGNDLLAKVQSYIS